jgi:hypothetical protein
MLHTRTLSLTYLVFEAGATAPQRADPLQLKAALLDAAGASVHEWKEGEYERTAVGILTFKISPAVAQRLVPGGVYRLATEAEMTPSNWQPFGLSFTAPREPVSRTGLCVIHGRGRAGDNVIIERYRDELGLSVRTGALDLRVDAFGNWYASLGCGDVVRVVTLRRVATIKVPATPFADFATLPAITAATPRRDAHAYPAP